jgi:predicted nucleic acid-binding protein
LPKGKKTVSVKKKSLLDSFAVLAWIQDEEGWLEAAEIKAQYPIAYADAFIVATALREEARIITGDPDSLLSGENSSKRL